MHEFSITERLFELAIEQADLGVDEHIQRLHIELDPDSGYAPDAIRFYFEQLASGSPAAGAELAFQMTPHPQHIRLTAIDIGDAPIEADRSVSQSSGYPSTSHEAENARWTISIVGVTRGVGFRPFVYKLAEQLKICGWVRSTPTGVLMEIEGKHRDLEHFCHHLQHDAPPLANILGLEIAAVEPKHDLRETGFQLLNDGENQNG